MKVCHCNDLDEVIALDLCLVNERLNVEYRFSQDTFKVIENVNWSDLRFNKEKGEYIVLKVLKKNVDTFRALEVLSRKLGIPASNIIYLGLKDRNSTSIQFFFIKKNILRSSIRVGEDLLNEKYIIVKPIGYVIRKPGKKDLKGNLFRIFINGDETVLEKARNIMDKILVNGLPSYYGYQRFGVIRPNTHYVGKLLLLGLYDKASQEFIEGAYLSESISSLLARRYKRFYGSLSYEETVYRLSKKSFYSSWRSIYRDLYSLFIESYQSYLFNKILSLMLKDNNVYKSLRGSICVPGFNCLTPETIIRKVLMGEGIEAGTFIRRSIRGWFRRILFKPENVYFTKTSNGFILSFFLNKGFYASIVLRELFKENLILS